MGDVIPLGGKSDAPAPAAAETALADGPHIAGPAFCGACHHEWDAVAPSGTTLLDCPKCARFWGAFKHQIEPDEAWRCDCGEQLFWLTPTGAMCRRCGSRSNDWAE